VPRGRATGSVEQPRPAEGGGQQAVPDVAGARGRARRAVSRPPASNRHSSTRRACAEKTAKLTPRAVSEAPSGWAHRARGTVPSRIQPHRSRSPSDAPLPSLPRPSHTPRGSPRGSTGRAGPAATAQRIALEVPGVGAADDNAVHTGRTKPRSAGRAPPSRRPRTRAPAAGARSAASSRRARRRRARRRAPRLAAHRALGDGAEAAGPCSASGRSACWSQRLSEACTIRTRRPRWPSAARAVARVGRDPQLSRGHTVGERAGHFARLERFEARRSAGARCRSRRSAAARAPRPRRPPRSRRSSRGCRPRP